MNENQQIISEYEEIDQIVSSFATSINDFTGVMDSAYAELVAGMNTLFDAWQADLATKFKTKMQGHVDNLNSSNEKAKSLKLVLDEVANDISQALNALREAGEDE